MFYGLNIDAFVKLIQNTTRHLLNFCKSMKTSSIIILSNLLLTLILDCAVIDDEPLWEPLEWSLIQTWLLFLFLFSWIAETLITSNYGSYTGKDKKVYSGLSTVYSEIEALFYVTLLITCLFVIVPFYFELCYTTSYIVSWWLWINRLALAQYLLLIVILEVLGQLLISGLKWNDWKKSFILSCIITLILFYLLFVQFYSSFFSYFTDINWYKKTGWNDFSKISHSSQKWSWGGVDRDHFSYHKTTLNFWFKNDGMFAAASLMMSIFTLLYLILLIIQWLFLLKKIYTNKQVHYTLVSYNVSSLTANFNSTKILITLVVASLIYTSIRHLHYYGLPLLIDYISLLFL
jgi:hypothetical protein